MTDSNTLVRTDCLTQIEQLGLNPSDLEDAISQAGAWSGLACPFPVTPGQYVEFARLDLVARSVHGDLNAFHNAKRAIDCQMDATLHALGLLKVTNNLPEKLALLDGVAANAPKILQKLIRQRNLLEHEYNTVGREEAEDAVDIAQLFVQATSYISDVNHQDWDFWSERTKIGGSCTLVFGSNEALTSVSHYLDFTRFQTGNGKQPTAVAFSLYKSTRDDGLNPLDLIQYRGEIEEYFDLTESQRGALSQECPELFNPEGVEQPEEGAHSPIDWIKVQSRVGLVKLGYGLIRRSQREWYMAFTRLMVRGMKTRWSS